MNHPIASISFEQALVLRLSPFFLGVVCILVPVLLSYCGLFIVRKLIPRELLREHHEVTGAILGTLGTVYGIFLAFIVATTWQFYSTTGSNLVQEVRCLGDLYSDAQSFDPQFRDRVHDLLRSYREEVVEKEWPRLERGEADPMAAILLERLSSAYASYKVPDLSQGAFFHDSVTNLNHMKELRASRIDDSSSGLIPFLWCVLLAGGAATISFTFLFSPEHFHAQAVMSMLLTGVICLIFYTIINLDFPFSGLVAISPEPFSRLNLGTSVAQSHSVSQEN